MKKTLEEIHKILCGLKQVVDHDAIKAHLAKHRAALGLNDKPSRDMQSFKALVKAVGTNVIYDASYDSIVAIGAEEKKIEKEFAIYYPIFEAFSAGLWLYAFVDDGILYLPIPRVYLNAQGQLHRTDGPAVECQDDGRYYLNGVSVTKAIVMTPGEKINPQSVIKEKNAEVRRELVRKIGVERLVMKLGAKVIDKDGDYELLDLNLGEERYRPYLKMKNPSLGTWHVEGVATECKTVQQAINWRRYRKINTPWNPEALT